jgi:hypothetical protein
MYAAEAENKHLNRHPVKSIQLPIKKIDDVKCDATIVIVHKGFTVFEIRSPNVFENNESVNNREIFRKVLLEKRGCAENPLLKEDIVSALVLLKKTLSSLSFDRYSGRFVENKQKSRVKIMNDFLSGIENITRDVDNCCVCMCETMTETPCGHYLCVPCWDSVKQVSVGYGDHEIPCPMCRKDITYAYINEE